MAVFDRCVGEDALQEIIRENADAMRCDFCGRESDGPIATDLETFIDAFEAGLEVASGRRSSRSSPTPGTRTCSSTRSSA